MKRSTLNISILMLLSLLATDLPAQHFVREQMLSRENMVRDIDAAMELLEKHHPFLYKYVDEEVFKRELDSVVRHLPARMATSEFYRLMGRTLYGLRHGHILLYPGDPDDGSIRRNILMQFGYEVFGDSIYIVRNSDGICDIPPGTRFDELNGADVPSLLRKYSDVLPVEGHGGKLRYSMYSALFPILMMYETGVSDTTVLKLSYLDSAFVCSVPTVHQQAGGGVLDLLQEIRDLSFSEIKRDSSGISSPFGRLRFPEGSHDIAVLTVNSFMYPAGDFYRLSFRLLDSLKTEHLIIDLRDNMGGLLLHATELFSYLSDSSFRFIERPIVNSRFRIFYPPGIPFSQHVLTTVLFPVAFYVYSPIQRLSEGGFSHNAMETRERLTSPYRFRGSVSLLVNSGTYSAASLLAANLKYAGNRLVVGEETGGATEGTVAMRLSTHVLPASRFRLRFGLGFIQPFYRGGEPGYGVMPDVLVAPSLNDRIRGEDPQMQTLLNLLRRSREE